MKRVFITGLVVLLALVSYCQISIERSDVFNLGDEIPRIYYAFEQDDESYHVDSIIDESVVFDDLEFPYVEIDTLVYQDPSETDLDGLYEDATCAYMTREGYVMHLLITEEKSSLVGFQGQLPLSGDPMSLVFTDTLVLNTYPCEFDAQHQDIGTAFENQHISVFESIIPAEYYSTVTALYDTVRFIMELDVKVSYDEYGEMQYIGDSNLNGTYQYLRENRKLINVFDIQLRSKFTGTYTPLADVPGIGDQLPMDLPMIDTTISYEYWTKEMKSPLAIVELNTNYDSVKNVTFRYAYLSSVPQLSKINHQVYPNPASESINVFVEKYTDCKVEIFSADGRKVIELDLESDITVVDLDALSSGNYIYRIINGSSCAIAGGKFVKK